MRHDRIITCVLVYLLVAGISTASARAAQPGVAYGLGEQELVQALADWQQVNLNGFGVPQTSEISALEAFNGYLYAGTYNPIDPPVGIDGAQIFRSPDGITWTAVTQPGFGNSHDIAPPAILDLTVFNGYLYAGTGRGNASQIWRTSNGVIWAPMDVTGFGDPDNVGVSALVEYGGKIYAGVTNQVTGAQIWSSYTGDNNSWTQVGPETSGAAASSVTGFVEFDGTLYAAIESDRPAQIWQSFGGPWETIVSDGFGDPNTLLTGGMAVFGGYLYVGAGNSTSGAQLWRTNDGVSWQQTISPGFGDPSNQKVETVFVFQNHLYASVKNMSTGLEIWRSADGLVWEQVNQDGFGDSDNTRTNWSNATANFLSQLYVGTSNGASGGQLWRMLQNTSTFADVPFNHPHYQDIEILYTNGLTAGCNTNPLMFCPDDYMNRAQAAVFMMRGTFGAGYVPPPNLVYRFGDEWSPGTWAQPWAEAMLFEKLTTGCSSSPLLYCPWQQLPREQLVIFGLKMKYGMTYQPPPASGTLFADLTDLGYYATPWAEKAYADGLITACGTRGAKPLFCPGNLVTRGLGAYVIVRAKNLSMP